MGNLCTRFRNNNTLSVLISLSVFSYIGETTRAVTEQLFGSACQNPGTVGWNDSMWTPCTTAPGTTEATGGALFTDLPANMIGCFLMGLFVSGDATLGLPVDMPVALLPRHHALQKWTRTHFGLRTGLCGTLTTFASWNTQMVVMICGGRGTELGTTQWVSALFGYIIGLLVSMKAFGCGRDVALMIHRRTNPDLRKEADFLASKLMSMQHSATEVAYGRIHRDLPDLERRFLHDIVLEDEQKGKLKHESSESNHQRRRSSDSRIIVSDDCGEDSESSPSSSLDADEEGPIHYLQQWKEQTDNQRNGRVPFGELCHTQELQEIERNVLLEDIEPREELLQVALDAGWDVAALQNWKQATGRNRKTEKNSDSSIIATEFLLLSVSLLVLTALLLWGFVALSGTDPTDLTYRQSLLSALLAPLGTTLRWRLSTLNGKQTLRRRWTWLPLGTFLANMIGSVVSAVMEGLSISIESEKYVALVCVGAIKTGFAGCLSTVSTFVAETTALSRELPRRAWSYYYSLGSLVVACILGVCAYVWVVV